MVDDLKPNTEYAFRLAARSPQGLGAFTSVVRQRTLQSSRCLADPALTCGGDPASAGVLRTDQGGACVGVGVGAPLLVPPRSSAPDASTRAAPQFSCQCTEGLPAGTHRFPISLGDSRGQVFTPGWGVEVEGTFALLSLSRIWGQWNGPFHRLVEGSVRPSQLTTHPSQRAEGAEIIAPP